MKVALCLMFSRWRLCFEFSLTSNVRTHLCFKYSYVFNLVILITIKMEATKVNSAHLCNFEVMQLLTNISQKQKKQSLRTITFMTLKYLTDSPCKEQNEECISNFLKDVEPYKLTNNEKLLMVNNPPTKPLQIQLIVDESEERLTEEQVDSLLETVATHLPVPEEPEPEAE